MSYTTKKSLIDRLGFEEKFKKEKCDPLKHCITYCVEYERDRCPRTCYYAIEKQEKN